MVPPQCQGKLQFFTFISDNVKYVHLGNPEMKTPTVGHTDMNVMAILGFLMIYLKCSFSVDE